MRIPMQRKLARGALALALVIPVAACEGMNRQQQRALTGGAIGAAGGGGNRRDHRWIGGDGRADRRRGRRGDRRADLGALIRRGRLGATRPAPGVVRVGLMS